MIVFLIGLALLIAGVVLKNDSLIYVGVLTTLTGLAMMAEPSPA